MDKTRAGAPGEMTQAGRPGRPRVSPTEDPRGVARTGTPTMSLATSFTPVRSGPDWALPADPPLLIRVPALGARARPRPSPRRRRLKREFRWAASGLVVMGLSGVALMLGPSTR